MQLDANNNSKNKKSFENDSVYYKMIFNYEAKKQKMDT